MRTLARSLALPAVAALAFAGCSTTGTTSGSPSATATVAASTATPATTGSPSASATASTAMHHKADGGPAPAGMKPATNAKYPVGSKVTLTADHMPGMQGAPATVVGVYSTTTYAVTYTPTTGGPKVVNHKWVVQEELAGVGSTRVANGGAVTIEADHMPGMKGARGSVVSSTTEPVYIVDYTSHGMTMKNHKWVVESEITPAR